MISIDGYAYRSRYKLVDPMVKLIFAVLTIFVCLWADSVIVAVIVLLTMSLLTVIRGGTPAPVFFKLLLVPFTFLILAVITIIFNLAGSSDLFLLSLPVGSSYVGVTEAGLFLAARLFFKALAAVSCLYFLSLSTPLVSLLSALRRLKVPDLLLELMALGYRFVFILLETVEIMLTAQQSRIGYANLKASYRSLGSLAATLLVRSYRRGDALYTAMEARCYGGELRVLEDQYKTSKVVYLLPLGFNTALILATIVIRGLEGVRFL